MVACNNASEPATEQNVPAEDVGNTDTITPDTLFIPENTLAEQADETSPEIITEKPSELEEASEELKNKHDYYKLKNDKGFHFRRGQVLYTIKNWSDGIKEFDTVLMLDPEFAEAYLKRGNGKLELKDFKGALVDLETAVNYRPNDSIAFLNLALVRFQLGDMEGCIEANDEAIRLSPRNQKPFFNRGIAYAQLKRFDKAIEDFSSAIMLQPTNHEGYFNRGLALYFSGDVKAGCRDWDKAYELGSAKAGRVIGKYCE